MAIPSGQPPSASAVETTHLVLPPDTNHHGTAFGGIIMQWMDIAAGIAASRHCMRPTVTVAVDDLVFAKPIRVGDIVVLRAAVNFAGRTSMEVGVRVDREEMGTGERAYCMSAYFTFVAVDAEGKSMPVPAIEPQNEVETRRFKAAETRRDRRLRRGDKRAEKTD